MYNRYIPQPDGSYRRNPTQEQRAAQQGRQPQQRPQVPPAAPVPPAPPPSGNPPVPQPIPGFLKQLLPNGFDTGDLIIVLLLLLIAGDSREARNSALLTMALYFIL